MKKTLKNFFFTFLFFVIWNTYHSQWYRMNSDLDSTAKLSSVFFPSLNVGYVSGQTSNGEGIISKTIDGGDSWNSIYSISGNYSVESVFFLDDNYGFGVGFQGLVGSSGGKILKTTDGGMNWQFMNVNTINYLRSIFLLDEFNGIVVGDFGTILRTSDGGNTWVSVVSGTNSHLEEVYFTSSTTGYIAGSSGTILKTVDSGNSWTVQNSSTTNFLYGINFINDFKGYAVGVNGTMISTIDGGNNWTSSNLGSNRNLFDIQCINDSTAYVVGAYFGELIRKTDDSGLNWTQENSNSNPRKPLYDVFFINDSLGLAVGQEGVIIRNSMSTNGLFDFESSDKHNLTIAPNPFDNFTLIKFKNNEGNNYKMNIFDFRGKLVKTIDNITSDKIIVNKDLLTSGIYYFILTSENGNYLTDKFIVK